MDDLSRNATKVALRTGRMGIPGIASAEMAVFAGAQMFDICDIENRTALMATVSANSM